jgi:hypothetical protein
VAAALLAWILQDGGWCGEIGETGGWGLGKTGVRRGLGRTGETDGGDWEIGRGWR